MKYDGVTVAKIVFSIFGVICLVLAGNTGINYAKTIEAQMTVTITPISLEYGYDHIGNIEINVTYNIENPSRVEIEGIRADALLSLATEPSPTGVAENYKNFRPGNFRLGPGENETFVMKGFVSYKDENLFSLADNYSYEIPWIVYGRFFFRVPEFAFSDTFVTGTNVFMLEGDSQ